MELSQEGKMLLELLVSRLPSVTPGRPETYIGYQECHTALNLRQKGATWGESLQGQGLTSLANWSKHEGLPGITGLIINMQTYSPGKGYFNLFDKTEYDYEWWNGQIISCKNRDWRPYISDVFDLTPSDLESPERESLWVSRVIRDTAASRYLKALNNHNCQICGDSIAMPGGQKYIEAHHIKPLGEPHNGPDTLVNMICVCPNDHVRLDYGAIKLERNSITLVPGHSIFDEYIEYHNRFIYKS